MKTLSKILIGSALLAMTGSLQAQTTISYSNGTVERKHGYRFGTSLTQGQAIRISKEKAQLLKGSKIQAIEAAFSTRRSENLKLFITKQLGAEPVYAQSEKETNTRWVSYPLTTPYEIDGEEFFIGYTCDVESTYSPLLFDESLDFGNQLIWALSDNKWIDVSNQGLGAANVRFVVDQAPAYNDVVMKPIETKGFYKVGKTEEFMGQVFNFSSNVIHSFDLSYQMGEQAPVTFHVDNVELQPNSTYDFKLPAFAPETAGKLPFRVSAINLNGAADVEPSDNTAESNTYIYPANLQKKVLLESFTGQACSNCPGGHTRIAAAIEGQEDQYVQVAHHAGYQFDFFTMDEDYEYTWFYNGGTFAPAAMFNRLPLNAGVESPVFMAQDEVALDNAIKQHQVLHPYVGIDFDNNYDEVTGKNKLTVRVHTYEVPAGDDHRLNVCLIQDNIEAPQAGAPGNYVHNHVFRGSLNGIWGEQIELKEGETVERTFDYTLPDTIVSTKSKGKVVTVAKDMSFVAFVAKASKSPLECQVFNAASIALTQNQTTGIEEVTPVAAPKIRINGRQITVDGEFASATVYNLMGQAVAQCHQAGQFSLPAGIYVVRIWQNNGKATSRKVYLH